MQPVTSLLALTFALAGAREAFGPFLGVYLQRRGFDLAAMALAGLAEPVAPTPVGARIDSTTYRRAALAAAVPGIVAGTDAVVATDSLWLIGLSQLVIGVSDTSIAPLVAASPPPSRRPGGWSSRFRSSKAWQWGWAVSPSRRSWPRSWTVRATPMPARVAS